jgi:HSP20 family molecular chaperone IbpA
MPLPSVIDQIERLFDELVRRPWGVPSRHLVPAAVHPTEDGWLVELAVEGMQAHDLRVAVHGRRLTINGHRRSVSGQPGPSGWMRTQQETTFQQTITLPGDPDPESVEAKIEGSTLSIHVRRRLR